MIESIIDIVKRASALMQTDTFQITQKEGYANIVTSSDLAVQHFLCKELAKLLPGSGFLCEEEDMQDKEQHEYTWIIDPIDGTANYSRGIAQCAICVGLRHHEKMEMGVVYLPMTNELFHAVRGQGAYLNGHQIHVSSRSFANSILCTALSVYHKEYARRCSDIILKAFTQCNDVRRFGAAAPELCYLAMGRCELFFEYQLQPWDFAAASVILEEAGGVLSDMNGQPVPLNRPSSVMAGNSSENLSKLVSFTELV